ncbi:MAG: zf-HC2 domain-containing protein [Bacteroidales bacterium]|jgi:predicted anti-sigma-YlaC factor YlaD
MNCISDELIQKYVDEETTLPEETLIQEHLLGCAACAYKLEIQKTLASGVKRALHLLENTEVEIPEFKWPNQRKRIINHKFKRVIYSVSAACILVLVFFVFQTQKESTETKAFFQYNFESEYDANRTISQQELIINVIDAEGKVTEFQLE